MESIHIQKLREEYIDASFRYAVYLAARKEGETHLNEVSGSHVKPPELSLHRFKKVMEREFRGQTAKKLAKGLWKTGSKVAAIIAVVFLLGFTSIMSVSALRVGFAQLLLNINEEYTEIELRQIDQSGQLINNSQNVFISNHISPSYVPNGFTVSSVSLSKLYSDINYEDGNGNFINFMMFTHENLTNIDTENVQASEIVDVRDNKGLLVEKSGEYILIWAMDQHYFELISNCSKEEIFKIALSIK